MPETYDRTGSPGRKRGSSEGECSKVGLARPGRWCHPQRGSDAGDDLPRPAAELSRRVVFAWSGAQQLEPSQPLQSGHDHGVQGAGGFAYVETQGRLAAILELIELPRALPAGGGLPSAGMNGPVRRQGERRRS